ncbi:MAG: hypothetical protein KME43_22335 [Myxacorys chilensis ATA2-1-KO14]|jgi:hypothetical protein|nr:hypothetical protein [Myxacorys chilensis ATA2-1-KO14]
MVTIVGSGELFPNSGMSSNALNVLQNAKVNFTEKAGQAAGAISETVSQAKAGLSGTSETVINRVTETGGQIIGKGAETVGSTKTVIADSVQKSLNSTVYAWLNAHPLLSWFLTHPFYTIGIVLLTLLLLSGLLKAFSRITEQAWVFILQLPFKLGKRLLGMVTKPLAIRATVVNSSKSSPQEQLAEILLRLEVIQQEQNTLMQQAKTILTLEKNTSAAIAD